MSPMQSATFDGTAWRARSTGAGPAPETFILGTTEPTEANTGPRLAPTTTYGSPGNPYTLTISTPGTYSRIRVYGKIVVSAETGVTLEDCSVLMTGTPTSAAPMYGINFSHADARDNYVNFCSVNVNSAAEKENEWFSTAIRGRGFTAFRSRFHDTTDGSNPVGSASATETRWCRFHGCLFSGFDERDSTALGRTHNDAIQVLGRINVEVLGCTLYGGTTSCVILNREVGTDYGEVHITDNWLYGHPADGVTINVTSLDGGTVVIPNLEVLRNRVDRNGFSNGQIRCSAPNRVPSSFGATSGTSNGTVTDWAYGPNKNYYMDNGAEVRVVAG